MNIEESNTILSFFSTILAIPIAIYTIISVANKVLKKYDQNKLEQKLKILERQRNSNNDTLLDKYAHDQIKALKFKIITECNYNQTNNLLFNHCMTINENWINWKKCKRIKNYFETKNNALIIKFNLFHKLALHLSIYYFFFCILLIMAEAILVLAYDINNFINFLGFLLIVMLSVPLIIFTNNIINDLRLLNKLSKRKDLLLKQ
nr:hypothetical protein [uncultured Marinifilum sp.]